jgi:short-subunit dehydrogenase
MRGSQAQSHNGAARTVIVGGSSGIGAALAVAFARRGNDVAIVARREDALLATASAVRAAVPHARVTTVVHDVAARDRVDAAWDACELALGGPLDRLVYCAGTMPKVALDEFDTTKDAAMVETNFLGAIAWCNRAARSFLASKSGQIVGIASVAADRGRIKAPGYAASKAGFVTYLESLRNRLTRHGVSVVTVKPGFIDTDMLKGVEGTFGVISPDACATAVVRACERRRQVVYVPWWWRFVMLGIRATPSFIFRRLNV